MNQNQTNLLQGTLDMMILKSLALAEMHGLGIARRIEQITKGTFQVKPGSLFPALHRMEEEGWLTSAGASPKIIAAPNTTNSPSRAAANWNRKPNAGAEYP